MSGIETFDDMAVIPVTPETEEILRRLRSDLNLSNNITQFVFNPIQQNGRKLKKLNSHATSTIPVVQRTVYQNSTPVVQKPVPQSSTPVVQKPVPQNSTPVVQKPVPQSSTPAVQNPAPQRSTPAVHTPTIEKPTGPSIIRNDFPKLTIIQKSSSNEKMAPIPQVQVKENPTPIPQVQHPVPQNSTPAVQHPVPQNFTPAVQKPNYEKYPGNKQIIHTKEEENALVAKYAYENTIRGGSLTIPNDKIEIAQTNIKSFDEYKERPFKKVKINNGKLTFNCTPKRDDNLFFILNFLGIEDLEWEWNFKKEQIKALQFFNKAFNLWEGYQMPPFSKLLECTQLDFKSLFYRDEYPDNPIYTKEIVFPNKLVSLFLTIFSSSLADSTEKGSLNKHYMSKDGEPAIYTVCLPAEFRIQLEKSGDLTKIRFANSKLFTADYCVSMVVKAIVAISTQTIIKDYSFKTANSNGNEKSLYDEINKSYSGCIAIKSEDRVGETDREFVITAVFANEAEINSFEERIQREDLFGKFNNASVFKFNLQ